MPNPDVVSIPARRTQYWLLAAIGGALLICLFQFHQRMSAIPIAALSLFGGVFTLGGIKQLMWPTPFAVLRPSGIAFPLSRIKEIRWTQIIDAQVGPKSVTNGSETTVYWQPALVLRVKPEKDPSLLDQLAQKMNAVVRPDGTVDRLIDMSLSTRSTPDMVAAIRQRCPMAGAPHLAEPTNPFGTPRRRSKPAAIFVILFGGMFVTVGLFTSYASMRAHSWPQTNGVVISATIGESSSRDSRSYQPNIVYRYQVNGVKYTGHRFAYSYSAGYSAVQAAVARHPAGHATLVYYNPDDPSAAILEQTSGGFPLVFVGAGAVIAMFGIFLWRSARQK